MRRLWILSAVVLSGVALAADPNPVLEEAREVMREGLERELPTPQVKGPAQWPTPQAPPTPPPRKEQPEKDKRDSLGERVRNEASVRARAAAEERRADPQNNQGAGQNRTKAAKGQGPKQPRPPKP